MKFNFGQVVANDDPKHEGRVKLNIFGKTTGIPIDVLPWCTNMNFNSLNSYSVPKLGSIVICEFISPNEIRYWNHVTIPESLKSKIIDSSIYDNGHVLLWDDQNDVYMYYINDFGYCIRTKGDDDSSNQIHISSNNIITINNVYDTKIELSDKKVHITNSDHIVEVNEMGISLGSANKSNEPAVLGDKNKEVLDDILNQLTILTTALTTYLTAQISVGGNVPFIAPLVPAMTALNTTIINLATQVNTTKPKTPLTQSQKVTLD